MLILVSVGKCFSQTTNILIGADQTFIYNYNYSKILDQSYKKVNSIVVIKKGKLLLEEYFNGETRTTLHNPRLVSKSFTGALLGMAINDGYVKSEEQKLGEFYQLEQFKHPSAKKENVRLGDLLTMSSAFDGNDDRMENSGLILPLVPCF